MCYCCVIMVEVYLWEDGLWDIEVCLIDIKLCDIFLVSGGVCFEGQLLYDLWLCVMIDICMNVVDVEVCFDWVLYFIYCDMIGLVY